MRQAKKQEDGGSEGSEEGDREESCRQQGESSSSMATRHLAFEKNYPKNIFIPLIEHLSEMGLQGDYEQVVGTRESFEGKNVVSLAEIHRLLSQDWFGEKINLVGLTANMSNKILMNSKIKKKLFHLLLIRDLLLLPLEDPRHFKKLVSKLASEVAQTRLPNDPLFRYPSALIYLLSLFSEALSQRQNSEARQRMGANHDHLDRSRQRETSSKEEYKHYISKIINAINCFQGDASELMDLLEDLKMKIVMREREVREKYKLPIWVPEWSFFCSIVINNCFNFRRARQKLTFSLLNQWVQEFKDKSTSWKGFLELTHSIETCAFRPIVIVAPPQ